MRQPRKLILKIERGLPLAAPQVGASFQLVEWLTAVVRSEGDTLWRAAEALTALTSSEAIRV
jgi:hypothetical protein